MRPALHANILRHRSQRARRLYNRPHTFSLGRLLMIILVGSILFIPGLILTILGIQQAKDTDSMSPGKGIMYKAIGPTMCTLGVGMLFGAVVYYCCYGMGDQTRREANQQGSVMSSDSKGNQGTHASIRSHHENGSHLGSPDGVIRRPSYKGEHHSPRHIHHHTSQHQYHANMGSDEEAVPLAPSENFSTIDSSSPSKPMVSITVEDVSDSALRHSPSNAEETELMINGGVRTDSVKV
ncbi:uncharacterized protein LOC124125785 [Haliotis rufescens]|uniref:uncharacterized protein LOC124125785 n=1 Tax=Haliotis rufescens TaxID=6454 RepID=UPI001EB07C29|nr:uncharacterized protein LOC124125785 [Haliotis rufescens]